MAASCLLPSSAFLSHSSTTPPLPIYYTPTPKPFILKPPQQISNRNLTLKSSLGVSVVVDTPPQFPDLKLKLLSAASGLNKGLTANVEDMKKVEAAAKELEDAGGLVDLTADLDKLQGRWKLIYSSAFSSRTLGGSRPGPPLGGLLPITLGQVYQRIDVLSKDFDNIVELELRTWPLPPLEVTASLEHKFELIGSAKIKITFTKTKVKTTGTFSQLPPFELPQLPEQLRPPPNGRSGEFEVTYSDDDIRITRGDRGELRVFVVS